MGISNLIVTQDVTIANAGNLSGAANIAGYRVVAIIMPAAWTSADLTFQGSVDASTFSNVYDSDGNEVKAINGAATSRAITPSPALVHALLPFSQLKVRSGTSGSVVAQGAARTITLVLAPVAV